MAPDQQNPLPDVDPLHKRSVLRYLAWGVLFLFLIGATLLISTQWQRQLTERVSQRQNLAAQESLHRMSYLLSIMLQIHGRNLIPFVVAGKENWPAQLPAYSEIHPYVQQLHCSSFQAPQPFSLSGCRPGKGLPSLSCRLGIPKARADGDLHIPLQLQDKAMGHSCSAILRFDGLSSRQGILLSLYAGAKALATWQNGYWGPAAPAPQGWLVSSQKVQGTPMQMRVYWQHQIDADAEEVLWRQRLGTGILLLLEILLAGLSLLWLIRHDMDRRFRWVQEQLRAQMIRDTVPKELFQSLVALSVHVLRAHGAYIAEPDPLRKSLRITAICGVRQEVRDSLQQLPLSLDESLAPWGQLFPTLAFHRRARTDRHSPHVSGAWAQVCGEYPALRGLREVIVWPVLASSDQDPVAVFSLEIRRWQRRLFNRPLIERWDQILHDLQLHLQAQQRQTEKQQLLHFDALTGLATRRHFLTLAEEQLQRNKPCWLGILDLDYFNEMNTIYGDQQTDQCLAAIGAQIQSTLPREALLGRIGGDEFAILLYETEGEPATASPQIAAAINAAGRKMLGSNLGCSLGWAHFPSDDKEIGKLFHHASEALAQAKINGRNGWQLYAGAVRERAQRRLHVHHHFAAALQNGEIHFYLQGKGDLESRQIIGVEMLARWVDQDRHKLSTGKFMPYVEENPRLIRLLGRHALCEARRLRDKALDLGLGQWSISVNIGARHFLAPEFLDDLQEVCPDGRGLVLELTETAQALGRGSARPIMERCHELGYQLSMDDFGTGYSSLLSVARLPFDELKLDQTFIRQFRSDIGSFSIAGAARLLSHLTHIRLLAEGIETPEELRLWQQLGGRYIQGYILAPPLPENAFFTWHDQLMPALLHTKAPVPLQDLDWLWELMQNHQESKRRRSKYAARRYPSTA